MLKRVNVNEKSELNAAATSEVGSGASNDKKNRNNVEIPQVRIGDAEFPQPFRSGLEYASPARGTWNIVHTGMFIPEAHEIFVCASCCLRGVVLTAAEMGAMDRFSTVEIREHNLLDGDMEELVIEGVSDIINKLPKRPPAVLVYTSCVHHFTGVDLDMIYERLRERFPDIDFTDCYMNPIMRKSGMTPDQLMRSRLYTMLHEREINPRAVAIIGNDLPTDEDSELMYILKSNDFIVHEITSCKSYEEYQEMAESAYYISYYPDAAPGGDMLADRLGGKHIKMNFSFDYEEIDETFAELAGALGINPRKPTDISDARRLCEEELAATKELVGDTPIAIDYTYCTRPLGLAKMLLTHGFNVQRVYLDAVSGGDKEAFDYLKRKYPNLILEPTVHAGMRFANTENAETDTWADNDEENEEKKVKDKVRVLALGQKAAYFENTNHFVNLVEGGGMMGYEAIYRTARLMREAFETEKDMKELVGIKGLGCEGGCCS